MYAFAYDCNNYASWGPVYIAEMLLLPQTAPDVHEVLEAGKRVVTRSNGSFNSGWSDLGLEQTVVRYTKSRQCGIIGFNRQEEATKQGNDLRTGFRLFVRSWILCIFLFYSLVFVTVKIKFKPNGI